MIGRWFRQDRHSRPATASTPERCSSGCGASAAGWTSWSTTGYRCWWTTTDGHVWCSLARVSATSIGARCWRKRTPSEKETELCNKCGHKMIINNKTIYYKKYVDGLQCSIYQLKQFCLMFYQLVMPMLSTQVCGVVLLEGPCFRVRK